MIFVTVLTFSLYLYYGAPFIDNYPLHERGHLTKNEFVDYIDKLTFYLKENDQDALAWEMKGRAHFMMGDYQNAYQCYHKALQEGGDQAILLPALKKVQDLLKNNN